ncbi:MAG: citrate/2-methylcitrate synthase [Desulfotignum sp.]|nr:citrate/2-methylcitrate synthase [Desulfotignum sp.]
MKKMCDIVLAKVKRHDPLLDIGRQLEEAALEDAYFQDKHLYPNVDFYAGIVPRALGIPTNMFTVMFVLGRLPGWIAQWKEDVADPETEFSRPRQIYMGNTISDYLPFEQRKGENGQGSRITGNSPWCS